MADNNVVEFPQAPTVAATIDRALDENGVRDEDLRSDVHSRSAIWLALLQAAPIIPDEHIVNELDRLLADSVRQWVEQAGGGFLGEFVALAVGQAVLEQRARDRGVSLL